MKKALLTAFLTFALGVSSVPVSAQSSKNTFTNDVIRGILVEIGTEAALEILRALFSPEESEGSSAFTDGEYLVSVGRDGNDFVYYGVNLETRDSITLPRATVQDSGERQVYIWNNSGYRYQVAWRPNDPEVIRLQVFDPSGRELLNRLLYAVSN